MSYRYRSKLGEGYNALVREDDPNLKYIELGVVRLKKGESFDGKDAAKEVGLVILSGKCSLKAGEEDYGIIGERENVFAGKAYGVYLPAELEYRLIAESDELEVAVIKSPSNKKGKAVLIRPEQVRLREVGDGNWRRSVYDIVGLDVDAQRLVIGETINPPGNWSSYPPHKHDEDNPPEESCQEEVYLFRVEPESGFGMIRLYTDDRSLDEAYAVEQNDVVILPRGYHPVCAAGGYRLYYLWVLAGEKRALIPRDDPKHSFVKNAGPAPVRRGRVNG